MESEVEEVFESQTFQPFGGWHFERFCDRAGNTFPLLTDQARHILASTSSNKEEQEEDQDILNKICSKENIQHELSTLLPLNGGWRWSHSWIFDCNYTQCDEEGWSYGTSLGRINQRLAEGTSKMKKEYHHFLRRRRWIRTRIKNPPFSSLIKNDGHAEEEEGGKVERRKKTIVDRIDAFLQDHVHEIVDDTDHDDREEEKSEDKQANISDTMNSLRYSIDTINTEQTNESSAPKKSYNIYRGSIFSNVQFGPGPAMSSNDHNVIKIEYKEEDTLMEGWLGQRSSLSRRWKLRYFLLRADTSCLVCLRDKTSRMQINETFIDRHTSVLMEETSNRQQFQFLIMNGDHKIRLNAVDNVCRSKWMSAVSELIVQSRASFLAGDNDSESGMSTGRSTRQLRRMRSSLDPSMHSSRGTIDTTATTSNEVKRKHKKAWRPYKLIAATMHDTQQTTRDFLKNYWELFSKEIHEDIALARGFVIRNILILERSFERTDILLPNSIPNAKSENALELRYQVMKAFGAFEARVNVFLNDTNAICTVLMCNRFRQELFRETQRLNEEVLSFAQSSQLTVKPVHHDSPKGRIPLDWFSSSNLPTTNTTTTSTSTRTTPSSTVTTEKPLAQAKAQMQIGKPTKSKHKSILLMEEGISNRKNNTTTTVGRSSMSGLEDLQAFGIPHFSLSNGSGSKQGPNGNRLDYHTEMSLQLPEKLTRGHWELPSGVNDYVVSVDPKDLGSLIAFTLCSSSYVSEVEKRLGHNMSVCDELRREEEILCGQTRAISQEQQAQQQKSNGNILDEETRKRLLFLSKLKSSEMHHTDLRFSYETTASSSSSNTAGTTTIGGNNGGGGSISTSTTSHHHPTQQQSVRCVAFFAAQFHALRHFVSLGNIGFLNSICQSKQWETSGGKSGAFFSLTHDKRFVLKGIPLTEFNMFLHMAPHYFKFMSMVLEQKTPTTITKILGLYKITRSRKLSKQTTYVIVMENITYSFDPKQGQLYDLKGILRRRRSNVEETKEEEEEEELCSKPKGPDSLTGFAGINTIRALLKRNEISVLMDGNFVERIPVPVRQLDLEVIERAIQSDTSFLSRAGVIDYSMLVLIDEKTRQVVIGMIDYLHQFDFLKKMESTSKASLMFRNPTIISPPSYRRRFVDAMHRYFVGIDMEIELKMQLRADKKKNQQTNKSIDTKSEEGTLDRGDDCLSPTDKIDKKKSMLKIDEETKVFSQRSRGFSMPVMKSENVSYDNLAAAHSDGEEIESELDDMISPSSFGSTSSMTLQDEENVTTYNEEEDKDKIDGIKIPATVAE